jgi:NAD(P)H-dependent FMN reductase
MKVVAIVGSLRQESFNRKLAEHIKERYVDKFHLEVLTLDELPFYNQDVEKEPPLAVITFKQKVKEAAAVIWVTPEYNGTIPGVLGNAIDWLSRVDQVMVGKPSWLMGAATGNLGTVRAQLHLRDIMFSRGISSPVLQGSDVFVGAAHEKFDVTGKLVDEQTIQFIDVAVENFIQWMEKHYS